MATDVSIAIPARLASQRLPAKVLADIAGRPMLWHVWQQCCQAVPPDRVYIATDAPEIAAAARAWGAAVLATSPACTSGTERIASVLDWMEGRFVINVQADQPDISPEMLNELIVLLTGTQAQVLTPVFEIRDAAQLADENLVKVVRAADGRALYFSRSVIPFVRGAPPDQWPARQAFYGHVGVYAFRREALQEYPHLAPSDLERAEGLEQLRFLEAGWTIETFVTPQPPTSVDTPDDLARARALIQSP